MFIKFKKIVITFYEDRRKFYDNFARKELKNFRITRISRLEIFAA